MPFPFVPNVPGVPPLPRGPSNAAVNAGITLLVADAIRASGVSLAPQWGLFQDGVPVVTAESVISVDYRQDWVVSTYPVEQGAFESYDKVAMPFDARVRFAMGGSEADRQEMLDSVAAIAGTLDLVDIVTPEATYLNANVTHYDYRRMATAGVGLLVVDVWAVEIRVTQAGTFSNTQQPSGATTVNGGNVQPQSPTPTQENKLPLVQ